MNSESERAAFVKYIGCDRPETEGVAVDAWDYHRKTWCAALAYARAASANETGAEGVEPMAIPAGWRLVPIEPTESMVVNGFESWPDEFFSDPEVWDAFEKMTGCQQAAHKAQLCYAAMLASAPQPPAQADARAEVHEPHSDDVAVDSFSAVMKHKLALARDKGRGGWEACSPADLSRMLREHVEKGDPRDVANFCMMLWHHGSPIVSAPTQQPGHLTMTVEDAMRIVMANWGDKDAIERMFRANLTHPEPRAEVTDDDKVCAERYRWLRARMAFVEGPNAAASMSMRSSIPAPNHDFNADFVGDRFDASVDAAIDGAIAAARAQGGES